MSSAPAARIKVFWQPGCTSCLRTKEFLTSQGIEFESFDVHNDPAGMAELRALGARSVPIVALAGRFTYAQSLVDVIKFLDLKTKAMEPLAPGQLAARLDVVLEAAARFTRQFRDERFQLVFRNRNRTAAGIAFHVFRVAQMGLEASRKIPLQFEGFNDLPPDAWSAEDIALWGDGIRAELHAWWSAEADRALAYRVPTYYGMRTMHDVLERTAWHAAQHTRQLMLILQTYGVEPPRPLTPEDLAGLPLPDEVWDR